MPTIKASEPWIAVHIGAGFHSQERSDAYRNLCKDAIESAWLHRATSFHSKLNLSKFICDAISVLEDSPLTNAGFGSNLTLYGDVECDAALVDGQGQSGAVGAIRDVKNPIQVAAKLYAEGDHLWSHGRIPPIMLCGAGAFEYAATKRLVHGIHNTENRAPTDPISLIAEDQQRVYHEYIQLMTSSNASTASQSPVSTTTETTRLQDTVGAICIHPESNTVMAGVSSGGIWLKLPGRVGEAAIVGHGCYAISMQVPVVKKEDPQEVSESPPKKTKHTEDTVENDKEAEEDIPVALACSVTGTGEQIMRTQFAKWLVDRCLIESDTRLAIETVLKEFIHHPFLTLFPEKCVGFVLLKRVGDVLEFWSGHTTPSMGIGWMTNRMPTESKSPVDKHQSSIAVEVKSLVSEVGVEPFDSSNHVRARISRLSSDQHDGGSSSTTTTSSSYNCNNWKVDGCLFRITN